MARILKHSTYVRKSPLVGELVFLEAGQEAPDWSEGLLGDHLFENGAKGKPAGKPKVKTSIPDVEPAKEPEPEPVEVPHRGAHHTQWRKFLEEGGVNVPNGTSREQMVEMAIERYPDIEIPDDEE